MTGAPRHRALGAVTLALQTGHALVALATVAAGTIAILIMSPAHLRLGPLGQWVIGGVLATVTLHVLLMLATPAWAWLATRTQTRVSRLWAWLGYLIPVASYWLPARTLNELAEGKSPEAEALRKLVPAWGIMRGLTTPEVMAVIVYGLYRLDHKGDVTAYVALAYVILAAGGANLLSLVMLGQVRHYLVTTAIDERASEVFA